MKKVIILLFILNIYNLHSFNEWEQLYTVIGVPKGLEIVENKIIYIVSTQGLPNRLYKSIDTGKSWEMIFDSFIGADASRNICVIDTSNIFISFNKGLLYKSNNGGRSFEKVNLESDLSIEVIEMRNKNIGIAFTNLAYYVTYNGWKTNKKIDLVPYGFAVSPKFINDSIVKMVYLNETGFYFSKLNIKTQATELSFITESKNDVSDFCMINENLMFACGQTNGISGGSGHDAIFKSTDGGKTWKKVLEFYNDRKFSKDFRNPFGLQSIAFIDSLRGIAVGQFGKILYTYDCGESWIYEDELPEDIKNHTPPTMIIRYAGSTPIITDFLGNIYKLRKDNLEPGESNKYQISGRVWEGKSGQSGIPILNGYQVAMTNINGYYKFQKLSKNTYNIRAINKYFDGANPKYYYRPFLYSPANYSIELSSDTSNFDFNAEDIRNNFTISGIIKDKEGKILSDIEVKLGENIIKTDSLGIYTYFKGENKDYIIQAKKENYIFTPSQYDTLISKHSFTLNFVGELNTGIKDFNTMEIDISPNPATDFITIDLERCATLQKCGTSIVEIYDVMGVLLHTDTIHPLTSSHRMNIEHLSPGVYFLKIGVKVEKFVKM